MGFLFYIMEIWKTIEGFEDYQVSNHGRVKSLKYGKEKVLKTVISTRGYYIVNLHKDNKSSIKNIHQLVSIAFLNHTPSGYKLVVNHKDFDKLNNNVDNLEIVTARENTNKKHLKSTSKYTGVCWDKCNNKWMSRIVINGKQKYLGLFVDELHASNAYKLALKTI